MNATVDLYHGDCLEQMAAIPMHSVDAVIADPPYGTTACAWDSVIDLPALWGELKRIAKPGAPIVLFGNMPFTAVLATSNLPWLKYEIIYEKTNPKGFLSAKRRPLTAHENILVFCEKTPPYSPQKWRMPEQLAAKRKSATAKTAGSVYGSRKPVRYEDTGERYPTSVIGFSNRVGRNQNYHPTQKPIALMDYLVKTYSAPGDVVLDFCMGSGTTGLAAKHNNRSFIGIEREKEYFDIAQQRIALGLDSLPAFTTRKTSTPTDRQLCLL